MVVLMEVPKFRAFISGQMVYFLREGDTARLIAFSDDKWVYLNHNWVYTEGDAVTWDSLYVTGNKDDPNVDLMICSPYKDRKGNPIWEGDVIISWNNDQSRDTWKAGDVGRAVVTFSLEMGIQFQDIASETLWNVVDGESIYNLKYLEVIGNIYANPELVEVALNE